MHQVWLFYVCAMRISSRGVIASLLCLWLAQPAAAEHTFLTLPIQCDIGVDCYIQNYADADPSAGAQDYTCGSLAYDTHRGTDFRIRGFKAMARGYPVIAAAPGVVTGVRDGMKDINVRKIRNKDLLRHIKEKSALGNVVAIRHDHGVIAYYGHMREGSVRVKKGQRVARGEPLGLVGLSGNTEFPHVHFEVRRNKKVVDPFTGLDSPAGCRAASATPLWHPETFAELAYVPTGLHKAGFAAAMPDAESIEAGRHDSVTLDRESPALLFWAMVYGPRRGDEEMVQVVAPDGSVMAEHRGIVERNQAQSWRAVGKRRRGGPWLAGEYKGRYVLTRGAGDVKETVVEVERSLTIPPR